MSISVGFAETRGIPSSAVRTFYKTFWPRSVALTDKKFYEWQFILPPGNSGRDTCVVAEQDGRVVGAMGLNVRDFFLSGKTLRGAELTTWAVDPSMKGQGIGQKILDFIKSEFEVAIGMGITDEALSIYMKNGFRYLSAIPRFFKVIDPEKLQSVAEFNPSGAKLAKYWKPEPKSVSFKRVNWRNCTRAPSLDNNHFSRDIRHLIWRYEDHPYFDYYSFEVEVEGGLLPPAYVVMRPECTSEIRIMHIVDIIGSFQGFAAALEFAIEFSRQENFWVVDMFSTYSKLNSFFLSCGWFSAVDDRSFQIPHRYRPLEMRSPPTNSMIFWSREDFRGMADVSQLYVTKQDADFDRPTPEQVGQNRH